MNSKEHFQGTLLELRTLLKKTFKFCVDVIKAGGIDTPELTR